MIEPPSSANQEQTGLGKLKIYTPPAIILELNLETRAGSPIGPDSIIDPIDLTGLEGGE